MTKWAGVPKHGSNQGGQRIKRGEKEETNTRFGGCEGLGRGNVRETRLRWEKSKHPAGVSFGRFRQTYRLANWMTGFSDC